MAGLAGALEVAGPLGQLTPHVPQGYGFGAIIVAFVGRLEPLGAMLSSVLLSMFYIGGELAQSRLGLPKALTSVFQGLLLVALLATDTLVHRRLRWTSRTAAPGQAARDKAARDKAARDKAARDKAARDKAEQDKAARDKAEQSAAAGSDS
jgi:simple sugar transport system permease protein